MELPLALCVASSSSVTANSTFFANAFVATDGATSHSGRRTFITNLTKKGVSAHVLMELAGHKILATTQRYIDVNDNLLFEAAGLL